MTNLVLFDGPFSKCDVFLKINTNAFYPMNYSYSLRTGTLMLTDFSEATPNVLMLVLYW